MDFQKRWESGKFDIRSLVDRVATVEKNKTAIIYNGSVITYGEMSESIRRLIVGLSTRYRAGEVLALWMPNCPELLYIYLACFKLGITPMPLHAEMKWPEVKNIIIKSEVQNIIVSADIADSEKVDFSNTMIKDVFVHGGTLVDKVFTSFDVLLAGFHEKSIRLTNTSSKNNGWKRKAQKRAFILHTSGSEGEPKGVELSYEAFNHIIKYRVKFTQVDDDSLTVMASCLTQSVGLHQTLSMLSVNGTVVLLESYDIEKMVRAINQFKPSHLIMVVKPFSQLLQHPEIKTESFNNIKFSCAGADKVTSKIHQRYLQITGKVLSVSYGLTESSWALTNIEGRTDKCMALGKPGPGIEIKLIGEKGEIVSDTEIGEILVKSPRTMLGYLNDSAATCSAFSGEWLLTGDLAWKDEDDYYWFAGRKKHLLVASTGDTISPLEIEAAILSHAGVAECLVISGKGKEEFESEVPWAYIVSDDLDESKIRRHLSLLISDYKIPQKFIFVPELPIGLTGKVTKPI